MVPSVKGYKDATTSKAEAESERTLRSSLRFWSSISPGHFSRGGRSRAGDVPGCAVGHTGTLDPLATSVLVLALGQATGSPTTSGKPRYRAGVRFGATNAPMPEGLTPATVRCRRAGNSRAIADSSARRTNRRRHFRRTSTARAIAWPEGKNRRFETEVVRIERIELWIIVPRRGNGCACKEPISARSRALGPPAAARR
jgi:hypothetical protein